MLLKKRNHWDANRAQKGMRLTLLVAGLFVGCLLAVGAARADTVTDWNAIMQQTVSVAPTNPNFQTRWGAIVQLAVFEAVNAIHGDYEPYLGLVEAPAWASPDAAVIAAAHRTLVTLRSDSAATVTNLDTLRDEALAAIADGPEKDAGIAAGEAAAAAMLLLRTGDGSAEAATTPYTPGTSPGDFQPPASGAFLPGWGQVTPFGVSDLAQFVLPPPPALSSGKYAADYNEVKLLGSATSLFRPQDRTDVARFYAASSPVQVWNSAARQVSEDQGLTRSENARLFAQLGMAMADAAIVCWDNKYTFNFWRPQSAIRGGDLDGNAKTERDLAWTPLITTPGHPSYPSGHASVSGAARRVLEHAFGKDGHDIVLTSTVAVVLSYAAFDEITADIDDARIYGGIHFRFDQEAGAHQGRHVGSYILENFLRSFDEIGDVDDDE
jgi:hypothetical protein